MIPSEEYEIEATVDSTVGEAVQPKRYTKQRGMAIFLGALVALCLLGCYFTATRSTASEVRTPGLGMILDAEPGLILEEFRRQFGAKLRRRRRRKQGKKQQAPPQTTLHEEEEGEEAQEESLHPLGIALLRHPHVAAMVSDRPTLMVWLYFNLDVEAANTFLEFCEEFPVLAEIPMVSWGSICFNVC